MLESITSILSEICVLDPARPVVVGVSGGPDSMCLLDIVHKAGYPVLVACLNHGLRSESPAEVLLVKQVAESLKSPFTSKTVDTQKFALEAGLSVEAAARQLRYDFLFSEALRINAQAIAVGHTADDQAETVLMHLLRGAGLAGLKGMEFRYFLTSWSTEIPLVRPLLNTWRSEIVDYCRQHNLTTAQDTSNQSLAYFRNQIRLDILPYLARYQPNIRQNLVRMANTLSADYELVQNLVEREWNSCLAEQGQGYLALYRRKLIDLPVAVQRHILRRAMLLLRAGLQDIEFAMIERARYCLAGESGHRTCDIGAGLQLRVEQDIAWVIVRDAVLPAGRWPAILTGHEIELPVPGSIELENGWVLQALLLEASNSSDIALTRDQDPYQIWFDADKLVWPLHVRHRRPGDRLQPAGMHGKTVKLSDLMINLKLPYRSRSTWPLICSGKDIIWVPACRHSLIASIGENTQRLLQLKLYHVPGTEAVT